MKIRKTLKKLLFSSLFLILLSSCSEFLLVPITVNYPFDEDSPSSPSKYEIDINDGINLLEGILTKDVSAKIIENSLKSQYPNAQITVSVTNSTISTDDMIDIISGKTVKKSFTYNAKITPPGQSDINKTGTESMDVSACSFYMKKDEGAACEKDADCKDLNNMVCESGKCKQVDPSFSDAGIKLTIKNVLSLCKLSESDRAEILEYCDNQLLTTDELAPSCTYLEVRHENTSISIMLGEVKELQDYKKYLDKIYSATLNELTFSIYEKPELNSALSRFVLQAELFAQSIGKFKADGVTPCEEDAEDETCIYKGVDENGELENYFSDDVDGKDQSIRGKYLVGVFGATDFELGDEMKLLYTYHGKDILQTAIKHLNFQIGAKSYYLFFPQAGKPEGKLTADIKAKLFFNVEPLN